MLEYECTIIIITRVTLFNLFKMHNLFCALCVKLRKVGFRMKRKIIALSLIASAILSLSACGGNEGDLCFHDWQKAESEDTLHQAATCQSPAVYLSVCSKCGAKGSSYETGEKIEHSYTETASKEALATAATCTAPATYYKSCEFCGKLSEETFEYGTAIAHTYVKVASTETLKSPATCSSPSTYKVSCKDCGMLGTATFTLGPTMPHKDTEGDLMCDHCMKPLEVFLDDPAVDNLAGRHEFGN